MSILKVSQCDMDSDIEILSVSESPVKKQCITFESVKQKLSLRFKKCSEKPTTSNKSNNQNNRRDIKAKRNSSAPKVSSKRPSPSSPSTNSNKFIPNMSAKTSFVKKPRIENDEANVFEETQNSNDSSVFLSLQADKPAIDDNENNNQIYQPYYLENFIYIIDSTLSIEQDKKLFSNEDLNYIEEFKLLSDDSKKLYIRLYGRKLQWFRESQLKYSNISLNLRPLLHELCSKGFLLDDIESENCSILLQMLQSPELIEIGREYKLTKLIGGANRSTLIEGFMKLTTSKNLFTMLGGSGNPVLDKLKKRILKILGPCYTLSLNPKSLFSRIFLLFSLTAAQDIEDSGQKTQKDLFEILQIKRGEIKYPTYSVYRENSIFSSRQEVMDFDKVFQRYTKLVLTFTANKFDSVLQIYKENEAEFPFNKYVSLCAELPGFLRRYTLSSLLVRMRALLAECYEKLRDYKMANGIYQELITSLSSIQATSVRLGKWYDRLALNLERHLKEGSKALIVLRDALNDPRVRGANRLALYHRARRLSESKCMKSKLDENEIILEDWIIREPNQVTIFGAQVSDRERVQGPSWIYRESFTDGVESVDRDLLCGVEQFVIYHYRDNGFEHGVHGESATFWTIFTLLSYEEVLFVQGIPDTFYNERQVAPLDIFSREFYQNRKEAIDTFLLWLQTAPFDELFARIRHNWSEHCGERCLGVSWELFEDAQSVCSLVQCLGRLVLHGVLELFCTEARLWRSGMPDLVLWTEKGNAAKIIEVKGPGDKLSNKQILWLDKFTSLGADAEVCYVKNKSRKRLGESSRD